VAANRPPILMRGLREAIDRLLTRARLIRDLMLPGGRTFRYGSHRSQRGELHLPSGSGPHPVVVLIHGGSWQKRYSKLVTRALARDLRRRGWAVWNIEYRRIGAGGGWPETFADVGAAVDHVRALEAPLDQSRVSVLGHSAGGHLALWASGRAALPAGAPGAPGAGGPIRFVGAVALAGVCDLATAHREWRGGAVERLLGGSPAGVPERYALADPLVQVPLAMPVLLVHGVRDETVSVRLSRNYARAARAAGGDVELIELEGQAGDHRAHIDPRSGAWAAVVEWLGRLAAEPLEPRRREQQNAPVTAGFRERR
jgi:acetyl esterase/lipase